MNTQHWRRISERWVSTQPTNNERQGNAGPRRSERLRFRHVSPPKTIPSSPLCRGIRRNRKRSALRLNIIKTPLSDTPTSVTSKGQVTIPVDMRKKLGIRQGSRIGFRVRGKVVEMSVSQAVVAPSAVPSAFDMLKSTRRAVTPAFDVATLLRK